MEMQRWAARRGVSAEPSKRGRQRGSKLIYVTGIGGTAPVAVERRRPNGELAEPRPASLSTVISGRLSGGKDGLETLEPRLSNIVRHAEKLTDVPGAMTESDLGELRAEGLSDKDILDLTMIVGYFNFVNRIAVGLGVEFSEDEVRGYLND